jgi:hypothetical protein
MNADFENTMNILRRELYRDLIYSVFDSPEIDLLRSTVHAMERALLEAMSSDEKIEGKQQDVSSVCHCLDFILRKHILSTLDEPIVNICRSYMALANNWSNVIGGCRAIAERIQAIVSVTDAHKSLVGAIEVLQHLIREARTFQHFNPPAYDMSRHFLQSIRDKIGD